MTELPGRKVNGGRRWWFCVIRGRSSASAPVPIRGMSTDTVFLTSPILRATLRKSDRCAIRAFLRLEPLVGLLPIMPRSVPPRSLTPGHRPGRRPRQVPSSFPLPLNCETSVRPRSEIGRCHRFVFTWPIRRNLRDIAQNFAIPEPDSAQGGTANRFCASVTSRDWLE